jgi:hypothetical protein
MKFLNELLGFAVLTGPLWLILILMPIVIWIAVKTARHFQQRGAKITAGFLVFLLVFFVLFADEIAGRIYLNHLCATEAGVKVYQTVELPAEYWDERGKPKFIKGIGALDTATLTNYDTDIALEKYPSFFRIEKFRFRYVEKQSGKLLGEVTDFHYFGGWIAQNFNPAPGGGASCDRPESRDSKGILMSIFRPAAIQHK